MHGGCRQGTGAVHADECGQWAGRRVEGNDVPPHPRARNHRQARLPSATAPDVGNGFPPTVLGRFRLRTSLATSTAPAEAHAVNSTHGAAMYRAVLSKVWHIKDRRQDGKQDREPCFRETPPPG